MNSPGSFTSLSNSHELHLISFSVCIHLASFSACIGILNFYSFSFTKGWDVWGVAFVPSERSIFNGFFGSCPTFVHCSELGGSTFRGTDLLSVCPFYRGCPYFRGLFREVPL